MKFKVVNKADVFVDFSITKSLSVNVFRLYGEIRHAENPDKEQQEMKTKFIPAAKYWYRDY